MAIKSRKGMVYVFVAILFLSVYLTIFLTSSSYSQADRQQVLSSRIRTIDSFITDLEMDFDRASFISAFRSLIAMEEYVSGSGDFFDNSSVMEESFREAFYFGTINGTTASIMENSTIRNYLTRVQAQADTIDINVSFIITSIELAHTSPWELDVNVDAHFFIEDKKHSSWWDFNKTFITSIPIYYLKDPLYTVNTYGRVPNTIRNYSASLHVGVLNDSSALEQFVNQSYYRNSSSAPSFLMRFTNNLTASPFGIESVVNLPMLSDQGIVILSDRSVIDYLYFSSSAGGAGDHCSIANFIFSPNWFRLDDAHFDEWEMSSLPSSSCP